MCDLHEARVLAGLDKLLCSGGAEVHRRKRIKINERTAAKAGT